LLVAFPLRHQHECAAMHLPSAERIMPSASQPVCSPMALTTQALLSTYEINSTYVSPSQECNPGNPLPKPEQTTDTEKPWPDPSNPYPSERVDTTTSGMAMQRVGPQPRRCIANTSTTSTRKCSAGPGQTCAKGEHYGQCCKQGMLNTTAVHCRVQACLCK
jgi:hypothetical protein